MSPPDPSQLFALMVNILVYTQETLVSIVHSSLAKISCRAHFIISLKM